MGRLGTIVAFMVLAAVAGAAGARQPPGLLYTCIESGTGKMASDAICANRAPETAASAAARAQAARQAVLKRYPDEAAHNAAREAALEASRARTVPERQDAEAARVNRVYDAQRERLRPLWNPPPP